MIDKEKRKVLQKLEINNNVLKSPTGSFRSILNKLEGVLNNNLININIFNNRITAMSAQRFIFVCINTILLINVSFFRIASANKEKCEDLTIPICKNLGYNATYMPNRFNRKTQEDVALEIDKFSPLIKAGCSTMLQLFLCSLYVPACEKDSGKELLPCRSVCESATAGCLILMEDHGVKFPEKMKSCDLWPSKGDNKTCVSGLDIRPATFPSSYTLTDKSRGWLTLKDKILTTVTLKNSHVSFLTLKEITVTLMLLKNTSVGFFDLEDSNLNLLTLASTSSVGHFTVLNTILNSFTLISTDVSHFGLKNSSMNSLTLMNTTVGFLTITNTNMKSFTLTNCDISFLTLINTTVNLYTRTNCSVTWIKLTNSDLTSQPSTDTIPVTTEKPSTNEPSTNTIPASTEKSSTNEPSTNTIPASTEKSSTNEPSTNTIPATTEKSPENDHSSIKTNLGIIIAVSKLQISAYFVLLYSINGFFS